MANPVPGRTVTTPFGKKGSWAAGYHTGDDYAAPQGAAVVATRAGKVIKTGRAGDYGNQVVIETNGVRHSYNHLSVISVNPGQTVSEGQQIGKVGSTGNSTGPHLHYEERLPPFNYQNHRKPEFNKGTSGSSSSGPYVTKDIYTDRLGYGQKDSDTVKELQERLNRISLKGGKNLPITGNYGDMTDAEVRKWQEQICGDTPDPAGRSYLGPKQRAKLFPSPPYVLHDKGLPGIASVSGNSGGGSLDSSNGGGVDPPPKPEVAVWHLAPSLEALRKEINDIWPDRDKSSDGTIGDYAHSTSKSEHNPVGHKFGPEYGTKGAVHAIDITAKGIDVDRVLGSVLEDKRIWYVIHNGFIWSKTYNWEKRPYSGSNPHKTHIHISLAADDQISAVKNEKDTSTWITVVAPLPPDGYITREEYLNDLTIIKDALEAVIEEE